MKKIWKKTNKIFRLIISIIIFIFFSINTINVSVIQSNVLGKKLNNLYEGINNVSWNSDINDLYEKTFISAYYNNSIEYFSLDTNFSPIKNINTVPDNIYIGYYQKKLQSVQYIYSDALVYLKLQKAIAKDLQETGSYKKINDNTEAILWCNSKKKNIYIVLYKVASNDKNDIILSVAEKKSIKEELNINQQYNLPTSICYREEK